jgi:tetratricopeptide (TPR) repeat protein
LILAALLAAATIVVYLQVYRFDFMSFDDPLCVVSNLPVKNGLCASGVRWAFTTFHFANWMPLTWLSYMLDATLYGTGPGGYHVTNMLIHVANVRLLFATSATMTGDSRRSALVAALFAVHPLYVEPVAWIAERKGLLAVLFGLLAICSLASKQSLVTLPFVLLLLDYWPLGRLSGQSQGDPENRSQPGRRRENAGDRRGPDPAPSSAMHRLGRLTLEKLPYFVASAAFCVVAVLACGVNIRQGIPAVPRLLNVVWSYGVCLRRAILPYGLAPFYPYAGSRVSLIGVAVSFVVLAMLTTFAVWNARRRPSFLVGWLWFLGTLVPTIGLVQIGLQQMADRYAYFPLIGLYVAAAWLLRSFEPATLVRRYAVPTVAVAVLCVFATLAVIQAAYWHDGVKLFSHALAVTEDNPVARRGLGSALFLKDDYADSLPHLQQAVLLAPDDPETHYSFARDLEALGRTEPVIKEYEAALALNDAYPEAHNDLGLVLFSLGRYQAAQKHFRRAIEINPNYADAYGNMGIVYGQLGNFERSIACSVRALEIGPGMVGCQRNLAFALTAAGRLDDAIARWQDVLKASPDDADARTELERLSDLRSRRPGGARRH